jgi:hypothetical protein
MSLFNLFGWEWRKTPEEKEVKAPYVQPENDDSAFVVGANYYGQHKYMLNMEQQFNNDADLILKYREISLHPEVDSAITDIVNEAITGDDDSSPVELITDDLEGELSDKVIEIIHEEFAHILELLDFNANAYEIFRKWYVDGRIAYLKIIDTQNPAEGIQELRYIPSISIKKVREEVMGKSQEGIDIVKEYKDYFIYSRNIIDSKSKNSNTPTNFGVKLTADSVCYCHSGLVDEKENNIYSYLHKALKPTNQLRMLEDAVIIYTLARAPQRRIFYVDVGNLPKNKAEEYLKSVMSRFKNRMVYDAITGQIKDNSNVMSMMEDFWLPRQGGSKGTEISTLDGMQVGGQIDILDFFRKKLYQSLYVPPSRISGDAAQGFTIGRPSEITREEIKFGKFISRLRKRFSNLFMDLLKTQLLLKRIITTEEWEVIKNKISVNYISDTHFKELKEMDILKERFGMLEMIQPYVGLYVSASWVRKKILQLNDEDIKKMAAEMEEEVEEMQNWNALQNPEMAQGEDGEEEESPVPDNMDEVGEEDDPEDMEEIEDPDEKNSK